MEWLSKLFDNYNRTARIYPALLALGPIIWSAVALSPKLVDDLGHSTALVVVAACLLHFLSNVARLLGKSAEQKLIALWGGWPTTILLRHRDPTIDPTTKARYHRSLSLLCDGLALPTKEQEARDPGAADEIYRSATKRLIERRRGPEYQLIHTENALYGFRRNLFGLRRLITVIAVVALVTMAGFVWHACAEPRNWSTIITSVEKQPVLTGLAALDFIYLALCLWVVRSNFVFQAAKEYAEALLRSLE